MALASVSRRNSTARRMEAATGLTAFLSRRATPHGDTPYICNSPGRPDVTYVIVRCTCIRGICGTRVELSLAYSRVTTVTCPSFARADQARGGTDRPDGRTSLRTPSTILSLRFLRSTTSPPSTDMSLESDGESRVQERCDVSLEHYIEYLLIELEYVGAWPLKVTSLKTHLSKAMAILSSLTLFVLVLLEAAMLLIYKDLRLFANIIGMIILHTVDFMKRVYFMQEKKKIRDTVVKLEKCHVLCQRIDDSQEGSRQVLIALYYGS